MVITAAGPAIRDLRPTDIAALVSLGDALGAGEPAQVWRRRLGDRAIVAIGAEPHSDRRKPVSDGPPADGGEIRAGQVRRVAVDLRSVTFIDSTTLAMLLAASRRQEARGGELLVLVGPQTPMTAFEVTGFDRLLAIRRVDDMSRAPHRRFDLRADVTERRLGAATHDGTGEEGS
jgi:hypothetical protein